MPIPDVSTPEVEFEAKWPTVSQHLRSRLDSGENILIHCLGGVGRFGMVAARLLCESGDDAETAICTRSRRAAGAIETWEREQWARKGHDRPFDDDSCEMFALPLVSASLRARTGGAQWFAELVATFGLIVTILAGIQFARASLPWLVGLYVTAAFRFTASTFFANPALGIARSLTNTVSGIRPVDLPGFIVAQLFGAACGVAVATWLLRGVTTLLPPLPPRRRRFPRSVPWLKDGR